ncbi:MAG: NAD+ synthase [Candidatus Methanomethylicus sp.]|nr:NAD+ synthase [Candidatus Methanomethylicus sp.]
MRSVGLPILNYSKVEKTISRFIKQRSSDKRVVLGLSGGVDSAVVASLAVSALGKQKVLAAIMPEEGITPYSDTEDAVHLAQSLRIRYEMIDIADLVRSFTGTLKKNGGQVAEGNLKARIRMIILYYYANVDGRLVLGSSDRSELSIGYFTKYGDGGADLLPIGGLFKSQVRKLALYMGIPDSIALKPSSPRLWSDQMAEDELGISFNDLDFLLYQIIDCKKTIEQLVKEMGEEKRCDIERVASRMNANSHKLRMPSIARIPKGTL